MNDVETPLFKLLTINTSMHNLNKKFEKTFGLSIVQWGVLLQLVERPCISAYTLSSIVGVHPSSLTQTLKRLERKQLIFVTEDPLDSRKKVISITKEGHSLIRQLSAELEPWILALKNQVHALEKINSFLKTSLLNIKSNQA